MKQFVFAWLLTQSVLLVAVSVAMFIAAIWVPDDRWVSTGVILAFMGIISFIGAVMFKDLVKDSEG